MGRCLENDWSKIVTMTDPTYINELPDELIGRVLSFVTERDLGRCRQVNRRLYTIANDPYILTQFPHIYVDGFLFLKEQIRSLCCWRALLKHRRRLTSDTSKQVAIIRTLYEDEDEDAIDLIDLAVDLKNRQAVDYLLSQEDYKFIDSIDKAENENYHSLVKFLSSNA
jgi:hypothetical protein